MAALRLAASRVNPALESGRALFRHLKEPHINAPVRRRHGAALCPQGVQAQTRALLIPGFHGIQPSAPSLEIWPVCMVRHIRHYRLGKEKIHMIYDKRAELARYFGLSPI